MIEELTEHYQYLSQFLTEARQQRFEEVLAKRTNRAIAVMEDTVKEQNASAVIRTMDALGFHELHLVENDFTVKLNSMISKGSDKWLDLRKSHDMRDTLRGLKSRGYKIVATCPHENGIDLKDLNTEQPLAVVFGNEYDGISDVVSEEADAFMQIPMYGFVESYNLSASVAMVFSHLRWQMEYNNRVDPLPEEDWMMAKLRWALHSTRSGKKVYTQWLENNGKNDLTGLLPTAK